VQTIDPALMTALLAMCAGALMTQAGLAKRQLAWRKRKTQRPKRRRRNRKGL
jgi:hypothetical protein